jgi:hypothetical protein
MGNIFGRRAGQNQGLRQGKTIGAPKGIVCLHWHDIYLEGEAGANAFRRCVLKSADER